MIILENLDIKQDEDIMTNFLIPINTKEKEFTYIMTIYNKALFQVAKELVRVKEDLSYKYGYDVVSNITARIKTPKSIINKMKKKQYELNYKSLIDNINDIAGIRVVCPLKSDIYNILKMIRKMPNINIVKAKDYLKRPKSSGYSAYHVIVETPVNINGELKPIKVEIQLRTMAMDSWATNEHKMKYKTNKKLSVIDSKKLTIYAKILNFIDDKMSKISRKQQIDI